MLSTVRLRLSEDESVRKVRFRFNDHSRKTRLLRKMICGYSIRWPLGSTCPFASCVRANFAGGVRNGVNGTPTFSVKWTAGTTDHLISLLDAKPQNGYRRLHTKQPDKSKPSFTIMPRTSLNMGRFGTLPLGGTLWCPEGDLNPHDGLRSADFKPRMSIV
jgi:hypothetical protein